MTVYDQLREPDCAHLILIDPDEQPPEKAGAMARRAEQAGTTGVMVGGSTNNEPGRIDRTVRAIHEQTGLPTILFPGEHQALSEKADSIFFMSLLNSRDPYYLSRAQALGAPAVNEADLEPLSMAYLIVEPGGAVGRVGEADLIERSATEEAANYALAGQYFGMDHVYLEAGSGAHDPVPPEMVRTVREALNDETYLLVGGGIRTPDQVRERVEAGADAIVTGTIFEAGLDHEQARALVDAAESEA